MCNAQGMLNILTNQLRLGQSCVFIDQPADFICFLLLSICFQERTVAAKDPHPFAQRELLLMLLACN